MSINHKGWVSPGPFQTLGEVREYVGGDLIQCLCCGKWFKTADGRAP
jgi:hypothetical protein